MNQKEIYSALGKLIRDRRKALDITQEKLAKELQMSRPSLANIEVGRQGVLVHQLYDLAEHLQLSPQELIPLIPKSSAVQSLPLPSDLKPQQAAQVSQLLSGPTKRIKK